MLILTQSNHSTCALLKKNIRVALNDYFKHIKDKTVLNNVSDAFVNRLAEDATKSKAKLRELFRKSSQWNEELQSLVISGSHTHNPEFNKIAELVNVIFAPLFKALKVYGTDEDIKYLVNATLYFINPDGDSNENCIDAIQILAPNAYKRGKKKSRIFRDFCEALGLVDDSRGSDWQKNYALISDEMNIKKTAFKLFVSINPAHFLTMSNPKNDERGDIMASCHSLNSDIDHHVGCVSYARDEVTMVAFTVENPDDAESLNNRKTSRQLFMYEVGNGVLLQNYLYTSQRGQIYGGVNDIWSDSAIFRDLIQREISILEGAVNIWNLYKHRNAYENFVSTLYIRKDNKHDYHIFNTDAAGLCISCGKEINEGLYCIDCYNGIC